MAEDVSILSNSRTRQYGTIKKEQSRLYAYKNHTITPGDTLVSIAVHYNTTVHQLKTINHLWSDDISNFSKLKVPLQRGSGADQGPSPDEPDEIELQTLKPHARKPVNPPVEDVEDSASYFTKLFDYVEKAKATASSRLRDSRLSEILTATTSSDKSSSIAGNTSTQSSSPSIDHASVIVASSSRTSLDTMWPDPSHNRGNMLFRTPESWNTNCDL